MSKMRLKKSSKNAGLRAVFLEKSPQIKKAGGKIQKKEEVFG